MNIPAIQNKSFVNFTSFAAPVAPKSIEKNSENFSIMVDGQKYSVQTGSLLTDASKTNNLDNTCHFVAIA